MTISSGPPNSNVTTAGNPMRNPEAEQFFAPLSAHSDVTEKLHGALKRLGKYEIRGNLKEYGAMYVVTAETVFCGAVGTNDVFFRLRPENYEIALATGAKPAPIGPGWVKIQLFRSNWPDPDIAFWTLKAYDFARNP
jgi:hypothetical protein